MRVTYTVGNVGVEVEGKDDKDVFKQLAHLSELYSVTTCECCGNDNLKFVVRTVEVEDEKTKKKRPADYYELHCTDSKCRARFSYGQSMERPGELFPKRKEGTNGWSKYVPQNVDGKANVDKKAGGK